MGSIAVSSEALYRGQIVDFYATELRAFNPALPAHSGRTPTVLVLGDSFTAGLESYPHWLQENLGHRWTVINSGVPGTTVLQASLILENRLERFAPQVVVYQTYVGNDLLDLRHPVSWRRVGPLRNGYWLLSDSGWTTLGFLNYRLGQIANRFVASRLPDAERSSPQAIRRIRNQAFSIERYRERERFLLHADPRIIERQIEVSGPMEAAWGPYSRSLHRVVDRCLRSGSRVVVLAVPHCVQVHQRYRDRFEALGAEFDRPADFTGADSPFVSRLRRAVEDPERVVVLDPLPALRDAEASGRPMYLNNDEHLTVAGQQVLARLLADQILSGSSGPSANQDGR